MTSQWVSTPSRAARRCADWPRTATPPDNRHARGGWRGTAHARRIFDADLHGPFMAHRRETAPNPVKRPDTSLQVRHQPSAVVRHLEPVPCYVRSMVRACVPGQVPLPTCPMARDPVPSRSGDFMLRPRAVAATEAYCTHVARDQVPSAFVQVKGLRFGAPGRIRTCATASGGRCSIP